MASINPTPPASFADQLFATAQNLLPKHLLSRWMYAIMRQRTPWLRNLSIRTFLRNYQVDMNEAVQSNPLAYESFNAFFTRALKPTARPIDNDARSIVSPVDGTVSQCGIIDGDRLIQAKGHNYSLLALLGGDATLAQRYQGGQFACIYLAPYNYHRTVPDLFARNERVVCDFNGSSGKFAMVFVGALFVGSIETVWAGEINPMPRRLGAPVHLSQGRGVQLNKGAEAGRFNMGSTVVLVFEPGKMQFAAHMQAGTIVRMGQTIGQLLDSTLPAHVDLQI
jgi:phosphatidylserine decarboxylase